jgi:hypothetical protein
MSAFSACSPKAVRRLTALRARFLKPWVVKEYADGFIVDARGVYACGLSTREDLHRAGWTLSERYPSQDEGRELAKAIRIE